MSTKTPPPEAALTRIGVAIAVHNSWEVLQLCLERLYASEVDAELVVVVFDDGSTDGTREHIAEHFPQVLVIRGDGTFWWTGGTNRATELCLSRGCDRILLLNPDAFVERDTIARLLDLSRADEESVYAALVVNRDDPDSVIWGGSRWGRLATGVPIWTSRYIHRQGGSASSLPTEPYETSEVHGRGVLFPATIFRRFGLHDDVDLPHLGGDTEYSLHLRSRGVPMYVVPEARVSLETSTTGLGARGPEGANWHLGDATRRFWKQLTDRRAGEQIQAWWTISRRHVPWYGTLPTFAFIISLGSFRYWQREIRRARTRAPDETTE